MKVTRILLVDDDTDDSELFVEAIYDLDPSVACDSASDGEDAFKKLDGTELPDVIFLDVNMPKMNGWECLGAIREDSRLQHIPVVMYSTSAHEKEVQKALSMGANNFFRKPDSFTQFKETLKNLLESF